MNSSIEDQIREIAVRATEENGLEFVHTETAGSTRNLTITVFIDKEGGVTHEDCVLVSRQIDTKLDEQELIPLSYTLEVSSPGLERGLYSLKDFEKFVGQQAKVKTEKAINGQKNFRGHIVSIENADIVFDDKTNGSVRFPYSAVVKANLEVDLEEELKRSSERLSEK